jgi:hypothetical protein
VSGLTGYLVETKEKAIRAVKEAFGDGADLFDVCLDARHLVPADSVYVVEAQIARMKRSLWMSRETVERETHDELVKKLRTARRRIEP